VGPMIENSLRQALKIAGGDISVVIFRPISLTIYLLLISALVLPYVFKVIRNR